MMTQMNTDTTTQPAYVMRRRGAPGLARTRKQFVELLRDNANRHDLWRIFSDFLEMAAIAISNSTDHVHRDAREARYMEIVKAYTKEEAIRFAHALAALTMALEASGFDDFLGSVFMELELGNKWGGQFFTPYEICYMMGQITLDPKNVEKAIEERGFVSVNDPCVGGGAMLIAMAEVLHERGFNSQRQLHVVGQDIDLKAVHMAYLQLSLLHIPAVIIHGNSLAVEGRSFWYTPAHVLGRWGSKLRREENTQGVAEPAVPTTTTGPANHGQFKKAA